MKKTLIAMLTLVIGIMAVSCKKADVLPSSVSVTPSSATVTEGETANFSATVLPADAVYSGITWSSSDTKVATVSNGVVTGVKAGSATITATADGVSGTATVTVNAKVFPVQSVSLDKTELELTEGDETQLTATVAPDNATDKSVSWKSADETIATVTSEGKVTAVAPGETTITVTTEDGGKTATCKVSVAAKIYPVESVSLDKTEIELTEGDEEQLTATIAPENASNKNVSWSSSDEEVATVSSEGKVTAVKAGTATITVTTEDGGKTATCAVTVNAKIYPVESVSLNKSSLTMTEGDNVQLTATIKPENASNKNVSWKSSNTEVAKVSSDGKVTAVKAGTATITVTTQDGSKTATCAVTVKSGLPEGALPGEFSVSSTKKVHFSKGNLVATINASGAPTAWKFAANQYDCLGEGGANKTIGTAAGDIDLFGWSTDAASNNWGIHTKTSATDGFTTGNFKDWGTAIDSKGTWRTLTKEEWQYLFNTRNNASGLYKKGVTVCGKTNCLVIAPDGFTGTIDASYNASTWPAAEAAGLVCLPAASSRYGPYVGTVGDAGYYWSSTASGSHHAYYVYFDSSSVYPGNYCYRLYGSSVRLITESK